jgi:hypothetical protein
MNATSKSFAGMTRVATVFGKHRLKAAAVIISLMSIAATHYAGFLANLPSELLAIAAQSLALAVTSVFFFYCVFAAAMARVGAIFLSANTTLVGSLVAFALGNSRRSSVRRYLTYLSHDAMNAIAVQILLFLAILSLTYVDFVESDFKWQYAVLATSLAVASVLRIPALVLSPRIFLARQKNRHRLAYQVQLSVSAVALLVAVTVIFSFVLGSKRFDHQSRSPYVQITDDRYVGSVRVLISSGDNLLATDLCGTQPRFLFFTQDRVFASSVDKAVIDQCPKIDNRKNSALTK